MADPVAPASVAARMFLRPEAPIVHVSGDAPMGVQQPGNVQISDDPEIRIQQSQAFWERNPGFEETSGVGDAVRGALAHVLPDSWIRDIAPTDAGFGQPMLDQMRWQIRTGRQPGNPWWLGMNAHLVGDGITAEAYLRAGRADELTGPNHRAWLAYLEGSDAIHAKLHPAGAGVVDAAKGASLLTRIEAKHIDMPKLRRIYWTAHDASIQASKLESASLLAQQAETMPEEARFSSAWSHFVHYLKIVNPPAANHLSLPFQRFLLPKEQPYDLEHAPLVERLFVRAIEAVDPTWPPKPGTTDATAPAPQG